MCTTKSDSGTDAKPGSKERPYNLVFNSHVKKGQEQTLDSKDTISAIYCFYSLVDKDGEPTPRLLYIGKSKDLRTRLMKHAVIPDGFPKGKKTVEVEDLDDYLCDPDDVDRKCFYAYAPLDGRSLEKCEAAMIKQFKPLINNKAKKSLGCHDESYFKIGGMYFWPPLGNGRVYHVVKD